MLVKLPDSIDDLCPLVESYLDNKTGKILKFNVYGQGSCAAYLPDGTVLSQNFISDESSQDFEKLREWKAAIIRAFSDDPF